MLPRIPAGLPTCEITAQCRIVPWAISSIAQPFATVPATARQRRMATNAVQQCLAMSSLRHLLKTVAGPVDVHWQVASELLARGRCAYEYYFDSWQSGAGPSASSALAVCRLRRAPSSEPEPATASSFVRERSSLPRRMPWTTTHHLHQPSARCFPGSMDFRQPGRRIQREACTTHPLRSRKQPGLHDDVFAVVNPSHPVFERDLVLAMQVGYAYL